MKIKKLSDRVVYSALDREYEVEINGKKITLYSSSKDGDWTDTDYDSGITEQSKANLTEEEVDEVEDNLLDIINADPSAEWDTKENEK